jgi:AraC family transcriptional regulator
MSLRAAAEPAVHLRCLHAGSAVEVGDWRCPGHDRSRRPVTELGDGHEVVVTRQGAYARECEGVGTLADAGSALFWHPGEEYRITHPVPGGDTCSVFRIAEASLRELLGAWDPAAADTARARFPVGRVPLDGPTYLLHRLAMHRLGGSGELGILEGEELATTFVRRTLRLAIVHAIGGRSPPRARSTRGGAEYAVRVREVVGRRPGVRLTLAGIAAEVGCSPFHLSRVVSAHEGVGVYGIVLQLRLRAALELVLESPDRIGRIAVEAGFASHSHFDDAFRREFGCAPGAARRLTPLTRRRALGTRATNGGHP